MNIIIVQEGSEVFELDKDNIDDAMRLACLDNKLIEISNSRRLKISKTMDITKINIPSTERIYLEINNTNFKSLTDLIIGEQNFILIERRATTPLSIVCGNHNTIIGNKNNVSIVKGDQLNV